MTSKEQRLPGGPGMLRGSARRSHRHVRGRVQQRADERLIELVRSGGLDCAEPARLSDRLTRLLVLWRREVLDGVE